MTLDHGQVKMDDTHSWSGKDYAFMLVVTGRPGAATQEGLSSDFRVFFCASLPGEIVVSHCRPKDAQVS